MFLVSFSCFLLDGLEYFSVLVNTVEYKHDDEYVYLIPDLSRKMFNISLLSTILAIGVYLKRYSFAKSFIILL